MALNFQPLGQFLQTGSQSNPMGFPKPLKPVKLGVPAVAPTDNIETPSNLINTAQAKTQNSNIGATNMGTPTGMGSVDNLSNAPDKGFLSNLSSTLGNMGTYLQQQKSQQNQPVTQPPQPTGYTSQTGMGTYASALANTPKSNTEAESIRQQIAALDQSFANSQAAIQNRPTGSLTEQGGDIGVLTNKYQLQRQALVNQLNTSLQSQQLQQTALQQAGQLTQPQLGAYGQTYYQPQMAGQGQTGIGTGAEVQPGDPFYQTLQQYAQMAAQGQLSQIPSSITGNAVLNAQMNRMAQQINPSYNPVISAASAGTQATGQQIKAAITPANQALDSLQSAFNNLPSLQATGIPILNQLTQAAGMATGLGREQVSAFQGALNEARARINGVLTGIIGVDAAGRQSNALLPDNMTPNEIPQKIAAAKQYLENQYQSYIQSGQQSSGQTAGGSPYSYNSIWQ